jgi:hypothetical protein
VSTKANKTHYNLFGQTKVGHLKYQSIIKNFFPENYCHSATQPLFKGLAGWQ